MNRPPIRPARLLAAVAAVLLLASCGDDETGEPPAPPAPQPAPQTTDEPSGGDGGKREETPTGGARGPRDERRIRAAIRAVLSAPDAARACREAMSDRFVETAYGDLDGCTAGRPRASLAAGSEIAGIEIEGDRADAVAEPEGGLYDGVELEVELVRSGERWLVDRLRADLPVGP